MSCVILGGWAFIKLEEGREGGFFLFSVKDVLGQFYIE
jgi:hypothetical protein